MVKEVIMNIKEAIKYLDELQDENFELQEEYNNKRILEIIDLLKEGEVYRQMIAKMKNEKYDVWVSLPGSFTNLPDFVRDVEKEVTEK